jgi:hypothetical protein
LHVRSIQRQKHVEPRASTSPPADNGAGHKRPLPGTEDSTPPDLQLSLSPTTAVDDAKKRKTTAAAAAAALETIRSSEVSMSLSLSPPVVASMQQQHPPREKTRGSISGEAVLGQSTLDLTMSIRALE